MSTKVSSTSMALALSPLFSPARPLSAAPARDIGDLRRWLRLESFPAGGDIERARLPEPLRLISGRSSTSILSSRRLSTSPSPRYFLLGGARKSPSSRSSKCSRRGPLSPCPIRESKVAGLPCASLLSTGDGTLGRLLCGGGLVALRRIRGGGVSERAERTRPAAEASCRRLSSRLAGAGERGLSSLLSAPGASGASLIRIGPSRSSLGSSRASLTCHARIGRGEALRLVGSDLGCGDGDRGLLVCIGGPLRPPS